MLREDAAPPPAISSGDQELLDQLHSAVASETLGLCYQPIARSGDGEITGFEALLRWTTGERQISPARFIPLAKQANLMPRIGRWVIATAARQVAEWHRAGLLLERHLHVNLSLPELLDPELPAFTTRALGRAGLQPDQFCFEVTERDLREGGGPAERAFEQLVAAGFHPVLDDFGVYSSVEVLTRYPFEFAKIHQSLLAEGERPRHWSRLVRGISGLARSLNITLIVEGVEDEQEMSRAAALGFGFAQGYALGRPDTPGNVGRSLADSRWSTGKT
ncbi:MAG TPA: EAL domain-containing protein [Solirubrobacterales bacterium]|nr:EAL domain-containing protein [Solirubrobacterales bacterium]